MIEVLYTVDQSVCNTKQYTLDSETYRGNIVCTECGRKAWFIRGYETEKMSRMACFAAHHIEGCTASTVQLVADDMESEEGANDESQSSDIYVDLDTAKAQSLYIAVDNNKHGTEESQRISQQKLKAIGDSGSFPLNKSLRQLLTNLCTNKQYLEQDRDIKVVADSGRVVLEGQLKDITIHFDEIGQGHSQNIWLFWGTINNIYLRKNGELWLNSGSRYEPSIIVNKALISDIKKNFKINDLSELNGADVLVIGPLGFVGKQALVRPAFTKYMTFRRHRVKH